MRGIDEVTLATFKHGMLGNDGAEVEDTNDVWQLLNVHNPTGAVGNAVEVAADRHEAVVTDAALELQDRLDRCAGRVCNSGFSAA